MTMWTLGPVALVGPSPSPAHKVTLHSPAHTSVGDSDSEAMDTPPTLNWDQEALPRLHEGGHNYVKDLSVGQNSFEVIIIIISVA